MSGAVSALIRRVTPRAGKSMLPPESAAVLAAIPMPVVVLDEADRFHFANPAAELFFDPADTFVKAKAGLALAKKKLGFRSLLEIVPLDATVVKGSHGLKTAPEDGPILLTQQAGMLPRETIAATEVFDVILAHLRGGDDSATGDGGAGAMPA